MAPITWPKRLCSAPGKTRKVKPSWWMKRRGWAGRLSISAVSSGSARTKPWTGSRMDSTGGASVALGVGPPAAEGAEHVDHLLAGAEDRQHGEPALGERLGEELELAHQRHVHAGGDAVDQLLEGGIGGGEVVDVERQPVPQLAGERAEEVDDRGAHGHDAGVALVEPGLLDRPHHRLAVGAGDL